MKRRSILSILSVGIVGFLGGSASAQTSFPMIGHSYPAGVQRGKTSIVTIVSGGNGGMHLYGAYKVLFEGKGVQAEIIPPEKGWAARDAKEPWKVPQITTVQMKVTVAPDAPLGVREYRVGTPLHGVSSVGLLVIGDEPEAEEKEPNNDNAQAQSVTFPVVMNGRFQQGEDVDVYKFKAEAGQEVTFAVECARLEDKIHDLQEHADPLLILKDLSGRELDRSDDYYRADPLLHHKFEKAGEYVLQIRDVGYKGNGNWAYRLTMTTRPYLTAVVPCAARPGQSAELNLYGFGLGGAKTARIDVPADAAPGLWTTQVKLPNGVSNPIRLLVTDTPQEVLERKPMEENKTIPAALGSAPRPISTGNLTLPGGANSWLSREGQIDRYKFRAKKGEAWGFEVTARRLDSNLDSEIKLRNAKGDVLASNDDAIGKDSRLDWTAPEDGDYTVEVRDLAGHAGPTYFYNLNAQRLTPTFRIKCDTDRAMIAPGNRTTWYVLVERQYGFAGEVKAEVKGLPAGVTATPATIPANMTVGTIFLTAAPDAKIDSSLVEVVCTGMVPGANGQPTPLSKRAYPVTEVYMPGGGRGLLEAKTQGVSVTEVNDLEVSVNTQKVTLQPGGEVKIEVTIKRRPDYNKAVTLDARIQHLGGVFANPLPPGVSIQDATIPENQTKGTITLKAEPNAAPIADLPISIFANVSINFVMKVWYSAPPISLTVEPKK